jgi:drug/metabolite transporter (DMT)-like permease
MNHRAVVIALISAALFGVSTPAAKLLLGTIDPTILAGLLYCGAGIGAGLLRRLARTSLSGHVAAQASLQRQDVPWLAGAIAAGGIAGPVLLMAGLARTDASAASLLLTLEGVATALLAWFVFRENFDRRIAIGMAFLVGGALVLSWSGRPSVSDLIGPLLIVGACVAWGLDNNLTRKVSLADPLQIVEIKGLIAGPVNLLLGWSIGNSLSDVGPMLGAGLVGFIGYGISLALFVRALRDLGTARTSAYFSTAPFIGAVVLHDFMHVLVVMVFGYVDAAGLFARLGQLHDVGEQ